MDLPTSLIPSTIEEVALPDGSGVSVPKARPTFPAERAEASQHIRWEDAFGRGGNARIRGVVHPPDVPERRLVGPVGLHLRQSPPPTVTDVVATRFARRSASSACRSTTDPRLADGRFSRQRQHVCRLLGRPGVARRAGCVCRVKAEWPGPDAGKSALVVGGCVECRAVAGVISRSGMVARRVERGN